MQLTMGRPVLAVVLRIDGLRLAVSNLGTPIDCCADFCPALPNARGISG
jgi:hypothetical protein